MKNTITLRPKDQIILATGLKLENVGDQVIVFDMPTNYTTYKENIDIKFNHEALREKHNDWPNVEERI